MNANPEGSPLPGVDYPVDLRDEPHYDALTDFELYGLLPPDGEELLTAARWRIEAVEGLDSPVLHVQHDGNEVSLRLDLATTEALYDGLRETKAWHRRALKGETLPPADDVTARIRSRFDVGRVHDWWADPASKTQRTIYVVAAIIVAVLTVIGLLAT